MHRAVGKSRQITVEDACDAVLDAYIDSFAGPDTRSAPPDRWLRRLIKELEDARDELRGVLQRTDHVDYRKNLRRSINRVENVLAQLYEEQLRY